MKLHISFFILPSVLHTVDPLVRIVVQVTVETVDLCKDCLTLYSLTLLASLWPPMSLVFFCLECVKLLAPTSLISLCVLLMVMIHE